MNNSVKYIPALAPAADDATVLVVPSPEILLGQHIPVKVPDGMGGETDGDAGVNLAMTRATLPEGVDVLLPPWSNMSEGDAFSIYWADATPAFTGYVTAAEVNQPLIRKVPMAFIVGGRPDEPHADAVSYEVTRQATGNRDTSTTIQVLVKLTLPGGRDPEPGTPGHQGLQAPRVSKNPIDDPADTAGVDVTIPPYTYMRERDAITLAWGSVQLEHSVMGNEVGRELVIHVTRQQIDSAGDSAALQVVYKVRDEVQNQSNDADNRPWSSPTLVNVELDPTRPLAPYFPQFPTNVIDLDQLGTAALQIQVFLVPGAFLEGDVLDVTWAARAVDGSPLTPLTVSHTVRLGATPTPIIMEVPGAEVRKAAEGRTQVNYLLRRTGKTSKSLNGTITGSLGKLSPPVVDEAVNGVIQPTLPFATVRIAAYDGFKAGDTVQISWTGTTSAGVPISDISNRQVTAAEQAAGVLTQQVAGNKIQPLAGRPVTVVYEVNGVRTSEALVLQVANQGVDPVFPAPHVVQANTNNVLNPMDATGGALVEVRYDSMLASDTITLSWVGGAGLGTPTLASKPGDATTQLVSFTVPASAVGACVGKAVTVSYQVRTAAGQVHPSHSLALTVSAISAGNLPAPRLPVAQGDILNLDTLTTDPIIEVSPWPFIAAGQRMWLTMTGRVNGQAVTRTLLQGTPVTAAQVTIGLFHTTPRAQFLDLDTGSDLVINLNINFDSQPDAPQGQALPFPSSRTIRVSRNVRTLGRVNVPKTYRKEDTHQYLKMDDVYNDETLAIEVPLDTALASDTFELTWQGYVAWSSGVIAVQTPGLKTVQLSRPEFVDVVGSDAQASYRVTSAGGETFDSLPLTVSVDPYPLTLVQPRISGRNVTVQYTGQASRHTVVVSAFAKDEPAWTSEVEHMPANPDFWVTVRLPDAWYNAHIGKEVYINYSMGPNDGTTPPLWFSRYLRVTLRA